MLLAFIFPSSNFFFKFCASIIIGLALSFSVHASYTIETIVGTGANGYSGDGGLATAAELNFPYGVFLDSAKNIYI